MVPPEERSATAPVPPAATRAACLPHAQSCCFVVVVVAVAAVVGAAAADDSLKEEVVERSKRTQELIHAALTALTGAGGRCTIIGWRVTANTASPPRPSHYNNASKFLREAL